MAANASDWKNKSMEDSLVTNAERLSVADRAKNRFFLAASMLAPTRLPIVGNAHEIRDRRS
jgi:hypothetical protein